MPRPSPKSAAAKKRAANAAKAKVSQSPNGSTTIKEISEEKNETISPLVEPSPKTACHHEVHVQESGVQAMDLSNRDPVQEPLILPPAVISVQASRSQDHCRYPDMSRNKQCTCNALTFLAHQ